MESKFRDAIVHIFVNMHEESQYNDFEDEFKVLERYAYILGFGDLYDQLFGDMYVSKGALWECFEEIEEFKDHVCMSLESF